MQLIKNIIYSSTSKKIYEIGVNNKLIQPLFVFIANKLSGGFLSKTKTNIDKISPSFCTAKWLQSTLHLEIGETHSCHHPKRHSLDFDQLKSNPNKLHNTVVKEKARREMLKGVFPSECEYCWKSERCNEVSDRVYKSSASWAQVDLENLKSEDSIRNVFPTYLEISFSSHCNLKCAYCYPEVSSSIRKEIEDFGPYQTSIPFGELAEYKVAKLKLDQANVDLEKTFWDWWDLGLYQKLKNFRITGGEPLINNNTFRVLDKIIEQNEFLDLEFSLNSNLMISNERFQTFLEKLKVLIETRKIKSFSLFASIDTYGESAEFLRNGLKIEVFEDRVKKYLSTIKNAELTFMVTYQALSPFYFNDFLSKVITLRAEFPDAKIKVGISELLNPHFLSLNIDPDFFHPYVLTNLDFMKSYSQLSIGVHGFSNFEIQHLERIYTSLVSKKNNKDIQKAKDFKVFITEYELRKGVSFNKTFLEHDDLINWYLNL